MYLHVFVGRQLLINDPCPDVAYAPWQIYDELRRRGWDGQGQITVVKTESSQAPDPDDLEL